MSRSMGALCRRTASRAAAPDKMDPLRRDDRTKRSTQEEPDMDTERFDTVLTLSGTRRHALRSWPAWPEPARWLASSARTTVRPGRWARVESLAGHGESWVLLPQHARGRSTRPAHRRRRLNFSRRGENIYKSAPNDVSALSAFTSWVNSSGHRANMLSSNFTQIGIGHATASDGRTHWTNTFGKPA